MGKKRRKKKYKRKNARFLRGFLLAFTVIALSCVLTLLLIQFRPFLLANITWLAPAPSQNAHDGPAGDQADGDSAQEPDRPPAARPQASGPAAALLPRRS